MNLGHLALGALVLASLASCEYPTSAPIVDQQWVLPAENTTIDVSQLLPAGVSDNGSTFAIAVNPFSTSESLGSLCPACQVVNGLVAPKPAFTGSFTDSTTLPGDVLSATLTSGSVQLALHNGLSFDPIRPGPGSTGTLTVTITDSASGRQLGQLALDGTTDSLPPGSTTDDTLTLAPGTVGSTVVATVYIDSPAGSPTTIDTSEQFTVTVSPSALLVSAASVNVASRSVTLSPTSFDVSGVDQTVINHVDSGGFTVDVTNPFGVAVTGTLQVSGNGFPPISKSFQVSADSASTTSVIFSGAELQEFLGKSNVTVSGSGVASAPLAVTIMPGQQMTLDTKLDLSLSLGG